MTRADQLELIALKVGAAISNMYEEFNRSTTNPNPSAKEFRDYMMVELKKYLTSIIK